MLIENLSSQAVQAFNSVTLQIYANYETALLK